jgi:hypothetical protein
VVFSGESGGVCIDFGDEPKSTSLKPGLDMVADFISKINES